MTFRTTAPRTVRAAARLVRHDGTVRTVRTEPGPARRTAPGTWTAPQAVRGAPG